MLGLALEGGGVKGAFHMGAIKAYLEQGYTFSGIAGTSIGALNGAVVAQEDFEMGYRWWEAMDNSLIFDIEQIQIQKFIDKKIDKEALLYLSSKVKDLIDNRGLDTSKMRAMLHQLIDEQKLRASPIDFGMVTVSVSDLKPLELYKEDIPPGKMIEYLMASANFPAFKIEPIDGKFYIDGGFYDNCPINLLSRKGYKDIIAIRTLGIGVIRKPEDDQANVTSILPSDDLGMILNFSNSLIHKNLKMGYYDTLRVIKGLKGHRYYILPDDNDRFLQILLRLSDEQINRIGDMMMLPKMEPKRLLFEKVLPELSRMLSLSASATYQDLIIRLIEPIAENAGIDRYKLFSFSDYMEKVKTANIPPTDKTKSLLSSLAEGTKLASVFSKETILKKVAKEVLHAI